MVNGWISQEHDESWSMNGDGGPKINNSLLWSTAENKYVLLNLDKLCNYWMWYIHPNLREICIEVESYKSVFKMSTQIVYIHCVYAQFLISTK